MKGCGKQNHGPSREVRVLVSGTYKHVTSHGKMDFSRVIMALEMGDDPEISRWTRCNLHSPPRWKKDVGDWVPESEL